MNNHIETLSQWHETALDLAIRFGPKLLMAIVIVTIGFIAGGWAGRAIRRGLAKFELDPPVRLLLERIVRVLVLGLFGIMALQNLGVELLPLIAGLGVAGAGIALAMQGVLSNIMAGLTIIFTKPYRVGEYISIVGEEGEVEMITLFSTTLTHRDHSRVVIPNRKIVGEILHNHGRIRQLDLVVGVAYDTDLGGAIATVHEVLRGNPRILRDPAPEVQVLVLADSSVNIAVRPWVNVPDHGQAVGEVNQAIVEAFRARRIEIPFPQREVRLLGNG